jgi:hypothetical protein
MEFSDNISQGLQYKSWKMLVAILDVRTVIQRHSSQIFGHRCCEYYVIKLLNVK